MMSRLRNWFIATLTVALVMVGSGAQGIPEQQDTAELLSKVGIEEPAGKDIAVHKNKIQSKGLEISIVGASKEESAQGRHFWSGQGVTHVAQATHDGFLVAAV